MQTLDIRQSAEWLGPRSCRKIWPSTACSAWIQPTRGPGITTVAQSPCPQGITPLTSVIFSSLVYPTCYRVHIGAVDKARRHTANERNRLLTLIKCLADISHSCFRLLAINSILNTVFFAFLFISAVIPRR